MIGIGLGMKAAGRVLSYFRKPAEPDYEDLCFREVCGALMPHEVLMLELLKERSGIQTYRNRDGVPIMWAGSRESQIDLARGEIIRKMILETATEADVRRLHRLSEERVARMTPKWVRARLALA